MAITQEAAQGTIYLVDGSNYIFRAFYAIADLSDSRGFPTNAIYGFTTMLMKLLRERNPEYIAVAFDVKGPTFRHKAFARYKATRAAPPDALLPQIPCIKEVVRGFSIPVLEQEGVEADDIIGTLARRCEKEGLKVVICSGDKDMMQLVSDHIVMIDTLKDKVYDRQAVRERFGVDPERVVEILGLMGDASDNIPGVPGIGPKGAQRLIEQFGTIETMLANSDKIHNARIRETVQKHAAEARMSRELAVINTDVDVDRDLERYRYRGPDKELLRDLFKRFEFDRLMAELNIQEEDLRGHYQIIRTDEELTALLGGIRDGGEVACELILSQTEPMRADIVGLALCVKAGEAFYLPVLPANASESPRLAEGNVLKTIAPLLGDAKIKKNGHDLKNALVVLAKQGEELRGLHLDTMVASYILNPSQHTFELSAIARDHLARRIISPKELVGSGAKATPVILVPEEKMAEYACLRADAVFGLSRILSDKIRKDGFADLFSRVEMPLIEVLASMERKGVLLDLALLQTMSQEIEELLSHSEVKIHHLAGEKFNVNSPKQLQVILFDKLGLPRGRKTKEGYSTDVDVLAYLAKSYELPGEILAYRSMAKLKSTYIDALPLLVNPETGRVHTSYNQTVTATGRLSSSNPNLQNIPIRTLEGKRIRQAFIAEEGRLIVSADYSQIELRVLAHLSGDETLTAAFLSGEDIHSRTASDVFGVFPEMVNAEMRRQAKVINFGVIYGMSAFGLSKELSISPKLAQAYIDGYFSKFKGVRAYLDSLLECARRNGFVTTMLNRRRYLPEINSSNATVRQFAERMAVNAPIQGTAADLIKVAMINIMKRFNEKRLSASMIMQVHDELVFEVPREEKAAVTAIVREEMEGVIELSVPLRVDCAAGKNWDEAHG